MQEFLYDKKSKLFDLHVIIAAQLHQNMVFVMSAIIWLPRGVYTSDKFHALM